MNFKFTTRTHEDSTKLLTAEFAKKIAILKHDANSGFTTF